MPVREEVMKAMDAGRWAARCECYEGHNSASGRCNVRDVIDPQAKPGERVLCVRCRKECAVKARREGVRS